MNIPNEKEFALIKHTGDSICAIVKSMLEHPAFEEVYELNCPKNELGDSLVDERGFLFMFLQEDLVRLYDVINQDTDFDTRSGWFYTYIVSSYVSNDSWDNVFDFVRLLLSSDVIQDIDNVIGSFKGSIKVFPDSFVIAEILDEFDQQLLAKYVNALALLSHKIECFEIDSTNCIEAFFQYLPEKFNSLIDFDFLQNSIYNDLDINDIQTLHMVETTASPSNHGYVYILSNPSMEGLVKIGMTTNDPTQRVKELSSATGVPTPFQLVYFREFNDCRAAETTIHSLLAEYRYNSQREFFQIETTKAINTLLSIDDTQNYEETLFTHNNTPVNNIDDVLNSEGYEMWSKGVFADDDEEKEKYYRRAIKLGYKHAWISLASLYYENNEERLKILYQGADDGFPQAYIHIADHVLDEAIMEDSVDNTIRDSVYRCLDLFANNIEIAYKAAPIDCLDEIKSYVYLSVGLNRKINKRSIAPIIKRIILDEYHKKEEIYDGVFEAYSFFDNYKLIEQQATSIMKELTH